MGCITGIGRVILIILNLVFLLISLALVAAGVFLKFFASSLVEPVLGAVSASLDQATKDKFNIPDLEDISDLPFVGEIGIAFIAFGSVLFFVSFMACCGACCKWRPLLVVFVIVMLILVICQGVVGGLFLAKDSVLHDKIKSTVGDKVKDEFDADGKDVFSFAINILQYLLGCCGIRGWEDFSGGNKPPSCCLKEIIEGDSNNAAMQARQQACTASPPTAPPADYNKKGCYILLQDKVLADITISAIGLAAILLLQVLEIIFAILIIKDVNDENNKIGPY
ncbi:tetraspanin-1-like [Babylonia areolata]|uniref:tetraspanin-1-like n=1 Tax=Babylonia areolata TaxID=304850 RepID=UPI003FD1D71D